MKLSCFVLAALAVCASPAVLAQQTPPATPPATPAKEEPGLKIRGLSFMVDTPPDEIYAHDPTATKPTAGTKFDLKSYLNHEFSTVPALGNAIVFTKSSDPASVKDPASVLARAKMPEHFKKGIFVFLPGTGKPGEIPFQVMVIDDAIRSFPRGSLKVINLSNAQVKIMLEKEEFPFKPGESKLIEKQPIGDRGASAMTAFYFKDNQWQRFGAGVWPHPGEKRVIEIIFENPKTNQMEVQGIRDIAVRDE